MKRRIFVVAWIIILTLTVVTPDAAFADWKIYYTGVIGQQSGYHGRGSFATQLQCEQYRMTMPGGSMSYCGGFDTPTSGRSSEDDGAATREQEKQRQLQLQKEQKEKELELARQKKFAEEKDKLLGSFKGNSTGTLGLKGTSSGTLELKTGTGPVTGCIEKDRACVLNGTPCCAPYSCKGKFPNTYCAILKETRTGTLGLKTLPEPSDGGATPFFGSTMPVSPENDANVVDLRGKKGIVDPNDPSLGYGKIPEDRKMAPTETEIINSLNALAKQQGWSAKKIKRLNEALCNLDLPDKDYLVGTDTEVTKVWDDVEARNLDKILAGDVSQGQGPSLPVGAGQQSHEDCTIFALANAARLPYGVVAARAIDIIREAGYHTAGEKADPQKTIETNGLNGGEVTMLAETFGRAEVVPPAAFADTLTQGRPVLVGLVYPTRDPNKDPLVLHEVVLTKTFLHKGARWYEMMNSNQSPWQRQYVSEKELKAILFANGVAYSPEPGTVVKPLR